MNLHLLGIDFLYLVLLWIILIDLVPFSHYRFKVIGTDDQLAVDHLKTADVEGIRNDLLNGPVILVNHVQ